MDKTVTTSRLAWSLAEISQATGLSLGFLRNDVRGGKLRIKKFGRRILIMAPDLEAYLSREAVESNQNYGLFGPTQRTAPNK
jgi:hypothetical protein